MNRFFLLLKKIKPTSSFLHGRLVSPLMRLVLCFCAFFFCLGSLWSANFCLRSGVTDVDFKTTGLWRIWSGSGWSDTNEIPDGDDIAFVNTADSNGSITLTVTGSVTVGNIYLESNTASTTISIVLADGASLSVSDTLGIGNIDGSHSDTVNVSVTGNGTISANTFSYQNTSSDSTLTIEGNATIGATTIQGTSGELTVSGDGTGNLNGNVSSGASVTIDETSVSLNGELVTTYYWTGAADDGLWTTSKNWAYEKADGSRKPVIAGYPGTKDNDTADFTDVTESPSVSGFTVKTSGNTVKIKTVENDASKRIVLRSDDADSVNNAKIDVEGWVISGCEKLGGVSIESGNFQLNSALEISGDLGITGGTLTLNNNITVDGNTTCSGGISFRNDGTNIVGTFLGNVDLSGMSASDFAKGTGTVKFFNPVDTNTGSTTKTFKTCSGQSFNNVFFGGNVTFDLTGSVTAAEFSMNDTTGGNYYNSADFTATLTGGSLTAGSMELNRVSSTAGVIGTLVLDSDVTLSSSGGASGALVTHSGTTVKVGGGKKLTVADVSHFANSGVPVSNFIVKGTVEASGSIDLGSSTGCTKLNVAGGGEVKTPVLKCSATTYLNDGETVAVANSGTIEVSDKLDIPSISGESGTIFANGSSVSVSVLSTTENKAGTLSVSGNATVSSPLVFAAIESSSTGTGGATVTFDSGSLQTFSSGATFTGSATNPLTMTSGGTWNAYFEGTPANKDFSYTKVENSASVDSDGTSAKKLGLAQTPQTVEEVNPSSPTTVDWFTSAFYWFGKIDESWRTAGNWFYDSAGLNVAVVAPPYDSSLDIVIMDNAPHELVLDKAITVKSFEIKQDKIADFAEFDVTVNGPAPTATSKPFLNDGTIRLKGSQTISYPASGFVLGADSTVEYYDGTITSLVLGNSYKNLIFSGDFNISLSGNVSVEKDFVIFGGKYSADDPHYSGADTRYACYGHDYSKTSSGVASVLSGGTFTVSGNFYSNGANLDGILSFNLPAKTLPPVFNTTDNVTERQWGLPFSVVYNGTVGASVTAVGTKVAASVTMQGVTAADTAAAADLTAANGFQFNSPKIATAYTVNDRVLAVKFSQNVRGIANTDSGAVVATDGSTNSLVGVYYNGKTFKMSTGVYSNKACTSVFTDGGTITAGTTVEDTIPVYFSASAADFAWNTDATGADAFNSAAGFATADSCDRTGTHRTATVDIAFLHGLFYAADGYTMCQNYGLGETVSVGGDSVGSAYDETEDHAPALLIGAYTGREKHVTGTTQPFYDAHNFIEFRYSEAVDIGSLTAEGGDTNVQASVFDSTDTASYGGALVNGGSSLAVSGFGSIASGTVVSGYKTLNVASSSYTGTTSNSLPHALYRKYALSSSSGEIVQSHRVRISVAGYVDESSPVDGYNNWIGYIERAVTPSGAVTPVAANIFDRAVDKDGNRLKNGVDTTFATTISRDSSVSDLYGFWDTSSPEFAIYVDNITSFWHTNDTADTIFEISGSDVDGDFKLDHVEIHLYDNEKAVYNSNGLSWLSQEGWQNSSSVTVSPAPDTVGGASLGDGEGGIRHSSLHFVTGAFRFQSSEDASWQSFVSDSVLSQTVNRVLFGRSGAAPSTSDDGLYISLTLPVSLHKRTLFLVEYAKSRAYITDLAGNLLKQTDTGSSVKLMNSVDTTPPEILMTLAPVGYNKVYAVFSKPLCYKPSVTSVQKIESLKDNSSVMTDFMGLFNISGGSGTVPSITGVSYAGGGASYSAMLFSLSRTLTLEDIENLSIMIDETSTSATKFSDLRSNTFDNLDSGTGHAISDFALNAVNVVYAFAEPKGEDSYEAVPCYDFTGNASGNAGRLLADRDITVQVQFAGSYDSNGNAEQPQNGEVLELFPDVKRNLRPEWISSTANARLSKNWRVWLLQDSASSFGFTEYAPTGNSNGVRSVPAVSAGDSAGLLWNFRLPNILNGVDSFNWNGGDEVQFIFKVCNSAGSSVTIDHDCNTNTDAVPLYALWTPKTMLESGNFGDIDLWSFTLAKIKNQRGGVTIINNVIDTNVREEAVVQVEMKESGNLNVFVMTLDGNIVKRLAHGRVNAGTHYYKWNGTNVGGRSVARGMYFVRVVGPGIDETRKVMCVKN